MTDPRAFSTLTSGFRHREKRRFASTAQMIEAIVMLFVVVCALAVVAGLLAGALGQMRTGAQTEDATRAAINAAEAFSADPAGQPATQTAGDLTVACDVTPEAHRDGTLYRAHISVTNGEGATVYELDTARYVASDGAAVTAAGPAVDGAQAAAQGGAA